MIDRILDWADEHTNPLAWLIRTIEDVNYWFTANDARTWWAHYLILAFGTLALWPFFGWWGGAVLVVVYWAREVYQVRKRRRTSRKLLPSLNYKWRDDLPDFFSALLGFLQVLGLLT